MHSHCTDIARNAHLIIVEDNDHRGLSLPDIVQGLECHAAGKGGVADEGNDLLGIPAHIAGTRQTAGHRQGIRRMARGMDIVGVAVRLREAGKALVLPERGKFRQTAGYQHMRIGLMPYVEQEPIVRRIDKGMHGKDDLHCTKTRGNMASRLRSNPYDLLADFRCQYGKLLVGEELEPVRGIDGIEYSSHCTPLSIQQLPHRRHRQTLLAKHRCGRQFPLP